MNQKDRDKIFWVALVIFLLAWMLVGCTNAPTLVQDPSIPATTAGYPTAEFRACGQQWHGLGVCSMSERVVSFGIPFELQGYYRGTVRVVSRDCKLDETVAYTDHKLMTWKVTPPPTGCLVTFTVSPEYPKREDEDAVVYSFRGYLAIKTLKDNLWGSEVVKVTGDWERFVPIRVGGEGNARVLATGCGVTFSQDLQIKNGILNFPLHEAAEKKGIRTCLLEGAVLDDRFEDFLFTIPLSVYNPKFSPLALPAVLLVDGKLDIFAENAVSVISVDNEYKLAHQGQFTFDVSVPHTVRLLTTAGRSILGVWSPDGGWRWVQ